VNTEEKTTAVETAPVAVQGWNRGDVILATHQAARAYEAATPDLLRSTFDMAHAVVERLMKDGFVQVPE
jgi:hypothetical protein